MRRERALPAPDVYPRVVPSDPIAHHASSVNTPPGYSHAVQAGGLIFISGQVALDADGSVVGPGDMATQARQAFRVRAKPGAA